MDMREIIKHLRDIERIEKPWGKEYIIHKGEYVIKILSVNKDSQLSYQYHEKKTETMIFFTQTIMVVDDVEKVFLPGQILHIPPGLKHRVIATDKHVYILEVSTNYLDDVVRIKDNYYRI